MVKTEMTEEFLYHCLTLTGSRNRHVLMRVLVKMVVYNIERHKKGWGWWKWIEIIETHPQFVIVTSSSSESASVCLHPPCWKFSFKVLSVTFMILLVWWYEQAILPLPPPHDEDEPHDSYDYDNDNEGHLAVAALSRECWARSPHTSLNEIQMLITIWTTTISNLDH